MSTRVDMSAHDEPVSVAYPLGAVDYLLKPLDPAVLRAKAAAFIDLFQEIQRAKRQAGVPDTRRRYDDSQARPVEDETDLAALTGEFAGVRLLSAGRNLATAAMGAAKLVEVTRLPRHRTRIPVASS